MPSTLRQLNKLAQLYGVQTAFKDVLGARHHASRDSLQGVLTAMGVPLDSAGGADEALRLRQKELGERICEPVLVAWDGNLPDIEVRLPESRLAQPVHLLLAVETGDRQQQTCGPANLPTVSTDQVDGSSYVVKRLPGFPQLPPGYHRLRVEVGTSVSEALVIAAPRRVFSPSRTSRDAKAWGVLAPVYALHSRRSLGAGDLADFETLWQSVAALGGQVVATLPMLATYLAEPFDPSPYSPISRLFWNEFYLALDRIPELDNCPAAQELLNSAAFCGQVTTFREAALVDYRPQMALRRRVVELLAEHCFQAGGPRWESLQQYLTTHAAVQDYACFRAVGERQSSAWPNWPDRLRQGRIEPQDYEPSVYRYHLYAQWAIQQQVTDLAEKMRAGGRGLYLDLPLGVHRHGYDAWRYPDLFASEASGGAPPDAVFTKGQDWGFPPLRPDRMRAGGYQYFIAGLRSHLQHAGILRIDHVMALHRLFWIPAGMPASGGVYVRYPADELYAVLCLESHRSRSLIVGENLGTVPAYVNTAMRRHAVRSTYVVQYELQPQADQPLKPVRQPAVASVNTHDMPPFAAFWQGKDLDDLQALGLFDEHTILVEHEKRDAIRQSLLEWLRGAGELPGDVESVENVLAAVHRWLAASPAEILLINLEDLWLEVNPQNTPGTSAERPNWRRKMRYGLEQLCETPQFRETLKMVDRFRAGKLAAEQNGDMP